MSHEDIVEIGLRYRGGRRAPAVPAPWISSCAYLGNGRVVFTDHTAGAAIFLDVETRRVIGNLTSLMSPRSVCSLPGGGAVIAEPPASRLTITDADGAISRQILLGRIRPWHAAPYRDGWLIVDASAAAIYLVGSDGGNARELNTPFKVHEPRAAVPTGRDTYLLCDSWRHQVVETTLAGQVLWKFGKLDHPSSDFDSLTSPEHACPLPNGGALICDTKNHRLVSIDARRNKLFEWAGPGKIGSEPGCLWFPVAAAVGPHNEIIAADAANGRVQLIKESGREQTLWGDPFVARCLLHSPRSVENAGDGYLVADSLNNRIVLARANGSVETVLESALDQPLFWPRFATRIDETLYVSDSRNQRILTISSQHAPRPFRFTLNGRYLSVSDPHSIRPVNDGLLLICDTLKNRLLLADRRGLVLRAWSGQQEDLPLMTRIDVADVHDADIDRHGNLWVADTARSRIVCFDQEGRQLNEIKALRIPTGSEVSPLKSPRSVQVVSGSQLLVCDTGNHRVLLLDCDGEVRGWYGGARGLARGHLSYPRFARLNKQRLLISDFSNNRVLDLPQESLRIRDGNLHD